MAIRTLQQTVENWGKRLSESAQRYRDGIAGVTANPMQAAAAKGETAKQRFADAIDTGKWQRGLNRVSLEEWKASAQLGSQKLALGAAKGRTKFEKFMGRFLPFLEAVQRRVRAMPNTTYEERRARAMAQMDAVHEFRRE